MKKKDAIEQAVRTGAHTVQAIVAATGACATYTRRVLDSLVQAGTIRRQWYEPLRLYTYWKD